MFIESFIGYLAYEAANAVVMLLVWLAALLFGDWTAEPES